MDLTNHLLPDPYEESSQNVGGTELSDSDFKGVDGLSDGHENDPFCWLSNFESQQRPSSSAANQQLQEVIDDNDDYFKFKQARINCNGDMNDDIVATAGGCIFSPLPEIQHANTSVVKTNSEKPLDENAKPIHGTQCGDEFDGGVNGAAASVDDVGGDDVIHVDIDTSADPKYTDHSDNNSPSKNKLRNEDTDDVTTMRKYMEAKENDDLRVVISYPKVVQKSYGSEKRFFCPPPAIHLRGSGWKLKRNDGDDDIKLFMSISGYQVQRTLIDDQGYTTAKNFYIPDSDKRKHFEIHAKMFSKDGKEFASFATNPIKVISKPSKKKQSVKNNELCITSNSKVALFNRLRSQTMSTRYLYTDRHQYNTSLTRWRSFRIHIVDNGQEESDEFEVQDGCIYYGMCIKLVCPVNNLASPLLIIRKVDKQMAVTTSDEPVSQLHKCALQLKESSCHYLVLDRDQIVVSEAQAPPEHPQNHRLCEGSCWTIISTDQCEFAWNDIIMATTRDPLITPVPMVTDMELHKDEEGASAHLIGSNFSNNLTIWFGSIKVESKFENAKLLIGTIPQVTHMTHGCVDREANLPLLLVRNDGVIYKSGITIQLSSIQSL